MDPLTEMGQIMREIMDTNIDMEGDGTDFTLKWIWNKQWQRAHSIVNDCEVDK